MRTDLQVLKPMRQLNEHEQIAQGCCHLQHGDTCTLVDAHEWIGATPKMTQMKNGLKVSWDEAEHT